MTKCTLLHQKYAEQSLLQACKQDHRAQGWPFLLKLMIHLKLTHSKSIRAKVHADLSGTYSENVSCPGTNSYSKERTSKGRESSRGLRLSDTRWKVRKTGYSGSCLQIAALGRQENQVFEGILSYIVTLRPAWVTWDSNKQTTKKQKYQIKPNQISEG